MKLDSDAVRRATSSGPTYPDELRYAMGDSSLGRILVGRSGRGVIAVLFGDDDQTLERDLRGRFSSSSLQRDDRGLAPLVAGVVAMIESPGDAAGIELEFFGTKFQRLVWGALREIPAGQTATYSELAARIGRPRSVRAVAQACGANPLAVLVPCHRVVRSDGGLAGYRWGVDRKRRLLQTEAAKASLVSPGGGAAAMR